MLQIGWKAGPEQYAPKEAGKHATRMPRLIELEVGSTDNIEAAIQEHTKYWASTHVPALFDQKIYTPAMAQENGEVIGPDAVRQTGCYSPNPEDHLKFAQQYIDLGFDTLIFHSAGPDQKAFIESYARDVLPKLRSLSH